MIIHGNNIEVLKKYPDNYFDAVVTDPPYGLGKEPDANLLLKDWLEHGYHEIKGKGFMGKEWDAFVPQPLLWKEVFRVLKHGGHVVAFYGTRTYDWGVLSMRLAGFEIRDCIQWIYGNGFPKSHNIGKSVDKIEGNERTIIGTTKTNGIKAITKSRVEQGYRKNLTIANVRDERFLDKGSSKWEGWGSALKPANEPIVLARKPLEKGLSIAENVLKWGTGGINIDGCRIGNETGTKEVIGRFPANIILDEEAAEFLDEQSGILKSGAMNSVTKGGQFNVYGKMTERRVVNPPSEGGASRFFYCAKASKSEKNKGLNGFEPKQSVGGGGGIGEYLDDVNSASGKYGSEKAPNKNFHPTVKPVKLMQYLARLITLPNGIVLDLFCGSGTTGIACKLEGFEFVGIEQDAEYCKIAEARIKNFIEEPEDSSTEVDDDDEEQDSQTKYNQGTLF